MVPKHKFLFSVICTAETSGISLRRCHLGHEKCLIFLKAVGIPFIIWSQGMTPLDWKWWTMGLLESVFLTLPSCSQKHWQNCSDWVDPAPFTRLCCNEWGRGRSTEVDLYLCSFAFPHGFSCNDHLGCKVFFSPFVIDLSSEDFTSGLVTGDGVGGFLHL